MMINPRCWAEIRTDILEDNYRLLRSLAPTGAECMAVVKANAYGHSLDLCAPAAVRAGAAWLGVTNVAEAIEVRAAAPRVVAFGGVCPGEGAVVVAHRITPAIWTMQHVDELEEAALARGLEATSFPVHVEIDTGMSRQGAGLDELPALVARFNEKSPLRMEAVMTHLYASDETSGVRSAAQLERLEEALQVFRLPQTQYLSVGSSASLLGGDAQKVAALAARFHLVPMLRIGLALYGVVPRFVPPRNSPEPSLQPVMTWKTRVASLREVPPGAEIGYNGTFTATEPMRVALIPVGYADGIDRRLGNHFHLLVGGRRAPVVGRVSMDHIVLDVTEIPGVKVGDEVVILGAQGEETISAYDHADVAGTIPWEIFTRIAPRVMRIEHKRG